jgi:hypothetical protein
MAVTNTINQWMPFSLCMGKYDMWYTCGCTPGLSVNIDRYSVNSDGYSVHLRWIRCHLFIEPQGDPDVGWRLPWWIGPPSLCRTAARVAHNRRLYPLAPRAVVACSFEPSVTATATWASLSLHQCSSLACPPPRFHVRLSPSHVPHSCHCRNLYDHRHRSSRGCRCCRWEHLK